MLALFQALLLAAADSKADGQVFNLGGCKPITLSELARLLVEVNGSGEFSVREFPPDRKVIDIGDYYADDRRIRSQLGWSPATSLEEGLARSLDFYRSNMDNYL